MENNYNDITITDFYRIFVLFMAVDLWQFNNLSKLDLSHNILEDHMNITWLSQLEKLEWLNFTGNPLSFHPYHRTFTCVCLNKNINTQSVSRSFKFLLLKFL